MILPNNLPFGSCYLQKKSLAQKCRTFFMFILSEFLFPLIYYGFETIFLSRATRVCARALPLIDAPV